MPSAFDVIGLGAVAVDDLYYLDVFPRPDEKVLVVASERQAGGLSGTALVAAARLGCSAAYAGTLGEDELSRFILDGLRAEGVSTEWVVRRAGARPYRSAIIVDISTKSRTILSCADGVVGAAEELPEEAILLSSRVLFVDHSGLQGMLRAARVARRAGIPVVGDFERRYPAPFDELLALTDHLVLPVEFARQLTGAERWLLRRRGALGPLPGGGRGDHGGGRLLVRLGGAARGRPPSAGLPRAHGGHHGLRGRVPRSLRGRPRPGSGAGRTGPPGFRGRGAQGHPPGRPEGHPHERRGRGVPDVGGLAAGQRPGAPPGAPPLAYLFRIAKLSARMLSMPPRLASGW